MHERCAVAVSLPRLAAPRSLLENWMSYLGLVPRLAEPVLCENGGLATWVLVVCVLVPFPFGTRNRMLHQCSESNGVPDAPSMLREQWCAPIVDCVGLDQLCSFSLFGTQVN